MGRLFDTAAHPVSKGVDFFLPRWIFAASGIGSTVLVVVGQGNLSGAHRGFSCGRGIFLARTLTMQTVVVVGGALVADVSGCDPDLRQFDFAAIFGNLLCGRVFGAIVGL